MVTAPAYLADELFSEMQPPPGAGPCSRSTPLLSKSTNFEIIIGSHAPLACQIQSLVFLTSVEIYETSDMLLALIRLLDDFCSQLMSNH